MAHRHGRAPRTVLALGGAAGLVILGVTAAGDSLGDCRAISDDRARLACYDALADKPPEPAAAATGNPPAGSPPAVAPPRPADLFGRDASTAAAQLGSAAGIKPLASLSATIATVERRPDGRLVIGLDNGQAWSQVDTRHASLRTGDAVVIKPAAFGSYLLSTTAGNASVRVRRDR